MGLTRSTNDLSWRVQSEHSVGRESNFCSPDPTWLDLWTTLISSIQFYLFDFIKVVATEQVWTISIQWGGEEARKEEMETLKH